MEKTLLQKKGQPKEFFNELFRIWLKEHDQESKTLPELIIKLNKDFEIDFCKMAVEAINDNFSCFDAVHIFEDTLSDMNLNLNSVLNLAETMFEGMKNDMASFMQFSPFESLIEKQPQFSKELLAEFLSQDKPYISGYISSLYKKLSKDNEPDIHNELCALKDHKSKYVLMALADVLSELDYTKPKNKNLIKKTLDVFDGLEKKNIEEINRILIFSYSNFLDHVETAKDKLISFSKSDQLLLKGATSQVLFRLQKKHGNEEWFSEVLRNLSTVSCEHKGIIDNIDYVLAGLIENNNWNLAEHFFTEWLLNSDYPSKSRNLYKIFDSTFMAFINKKDSLSKLLTRFFNHDSFKIHSAAAEITSYCQLHRFQNLKLDKEILKALSYNDCLFICRKILGYVISNEHLCSLCFSVLDAFPKDKNIQSLTYSIFSSHIGENHPGRTIDFFKKILSETKAVGKKKLASQVIEDIENYYKFRDTLPKLNELKPARQKSLKIFRESSKKMSAAMEAAQKGSIISMISSRVVMKQGTGSFYFMGGTYSEISKMVKISETMDLPHSEVTHPVDAALERINFRLARRGDK